MAKSKQKKRKQKQRREAEVFYESLPGTMTIPGSITMPALRLPKLKPGKASSSAATAELPTWFGPGDTWKYGRAIGVDAKRALDGVLSGLWNKTARRIYLALILLSFVGTGVVSYDFVTTTNKLYANDISSPAAMMNKKKTGITIEDRNGVILYQGYGAQKNVFLPLASMPATLRDATLAAEDPDFYNHAGFSWRGTARAAWVDITHQGAVEGGSTLTQQLVKNAVLTSDKSVIRKFRELVIATQLENKYSKDQILEMYLNEIYYGQGSDGVEAASQTYFHKPVKDLTLAESALIAGLPLGPSRYDPTVHPQAATDRRNNVLDRMANLGKITAEQATAAKATSLVVFPRVESIRAPHFVFYVLEQLRQEYGNDAVENNGMTVRTTLDIAKQEAGEKIVSDQINSLASNHVTNGGLVSMNPSNGDIISMVGSTGYETPGFGNVNVTLANLQPGSSFKPIVYYNAFTKGWNGSTQINDKPISVPNGDGTNYEPKNYDLKFRGMVTVRRALANSLNIPAVEALRFVGIPAALDQAKALGITTLGTSDQYGLSLVLGSGGVRVLDMATVYGTFANSGVKVLPRAILSVKDRYGNEINSPNLTERKGQAVADNRYVGMITSILSDNGARTEEFGANSPLKLSRPAAAKTGTTNDFRDNWTIGYTPNLVTAVWVGNNDHSAMQGVDGITGAAPIWHNYMEMALANTPVVNFALPVGDATSKVCSKDGGLLNPGDTSGYDEIFTLVAPLARKCGGGAPTPAPTTTNSATPVTPIPATPVPETPTPAATAAPAPVATP